MTYLELKRRTQRGDREAAAELLPQARAAGDESAILRCWRLLFAARHGAWQALDAALRTGGRTAGSIGIDTTQDVRGEVIARALVEGSEGRASDDALTGALLALARKLLDAAPDATWRRNPGTAQRLREQLTRVLRAEAEGDALEALAQAKALLEAPGG